MAAEKPGLSSLLMNPARLVMPVTRLDAAQQKTSEKAPIKSVEVGYTVLHNQKDSAEAESNLPVGSTWRVLYIYLLLFTAVTFASAGVARLARGQLSPHGASLRARPLLDNVVVAFAATNRTTHLLAVVFGAQQWRNLGVRPVVALVGEEQHFHSGPNRVLVNALMEMEAYIDFMPCGNISDSNLAQLLPFYITATPLGLDFDDDTVLIVATPGFVPLQLSNHMPRIQRHTEVRIYDDNCCGLMDIGTIKVHRYSANTIAMTAIKWMDAFELSRGMTPFAVRKHVEENFGDFVVLSSPYLSNHVQELALSLKMEQWRNRDAQSVYTISSMPHTDITSLDINKTTMSDLAIGPYTDIRLPSRLYDQATWLTVAPVYRRIFGRSQFDYLVQMRDRVLDWDRDLRRDRWIQWMQMSVLEV